jgi:hypothetical protein
MIMNKYTDSGMGRKMPSTGIDLLVTEAVVQRNGEA